MEEEKLIQERKKQVVDFLKNDTLFSCFLGLGALALIFSLWVKIGILSPDKTGFAPFARLAYVVYAWGAFDWLLLALLAALSAACVYYKKRKYAFYPLLAWIVWISVQIRLLPTAINPGTGKPGLWDITRDTWTLGPDLDPFLFLRWTKEIIAQGSLAAVDMMRYVPRGFPTHEELILHPYMIAWFHKITTAFGNTSVEYSAVIYPVFMFAIGIIACYLLVREMFIDEVGEKISSTIALVASFFITVFPALLPRTIAGIPEKEAGSFPFLFLAFYFFLLAWKAKKNIPRYLYTLLAVAATTIMSLTWGGYIYLYITIGLATTVAFLIGQTNKHSFFTYILWLIGSMVTTAVFTERYTFVSLLTSTVTGISTLIGGIMFVHFLITETQLRKFTEKGKLVHIPQQVIAIGIVVLLGLGATLFLGTSFIESKLQTVVNNLVTPTTDRLGVTVAENRQPFFDEWAGNFGPSFYSLFNFITFDWIRVSQNTINSWSQIPLFFWLFFIGSIALFYSLMKKFPTQERAILTIGYVVFLFGLIFSRYRPEIAYLNGTSNISLFIYAFSFFTLTFVLGRSGIVKGGKSSLYYKFAAASLFLLFVWILFERDSTFFMILTGLSLLCFGALACIGIAREERYREISPGAVMIFAFFFLSIISARGAVRLIMVLGIPASIIVAYFAVVGIVKLLKIRGNVRIIAIILVILIAIATFFSAFSFYAGSKGQAQASVPYAYTFQWQKAMGWVRDNTPQNAVFGHWWDYGYWLQSIGERATVLDGGNAIPYWNHLMGRYALTAPDKEEREALNYLYSHNATHFLIDSSDIGKYTAFSSIGSDLNFDRRSWIQSMTRSPTDKTEVKNGTRVVYYPGSQKYQSIIPTDVDIFYTENGTNGTGKTVSLLSDRSGVIGVSIEIDASGNINGQPQGIFFYRVKDQQKEESFPLRYAYFNHSLHDFGSGIDAGVFFMNNLQAQGQSIGFEKDGALLYLSPKTVHSQLARLYLYNEGNDPYFKLVYSQDSPVVEQIKPQAKDIDLGDIVFYGGVQGPIRIWEINYPEDIQVNSTYLQKEFPDARLTR